VILAPDEPSSRGIHADTIPVAPRVKSRPFETGGVEYGPFAILVA
jgi:hypothetical protein